MDAQKSMRSELRFELAHARAQEVLRSRMRGKDEGDTPPVSGRTCILVDCSALHTNCWPDAQSQIHSGPE